MQVVVPVMLLLLLLSNSTLYTFRRGSENIGQIAVQDKSSVRVALGDVRETLWYGSVSGSRC